MKISIAMATYNGAKYLEEQLGSFITQNRQPDEVVVCDDGSVDNTVDILCRFAERAPFPVRVVENEKNLGFTKNFEKAISLCDGEIVFISDQDDFWMDDKISVVSKILEAQDNVCLVINNQYLVDSFLSPSGFTKLENIRGLGLSDDEFITGCCTAIKKSLVDLVLPIEDDVATYDRWLSDFATRLGVRYVLDEPLQMHRRHGLNASDSLASSVKNTTMLDSIKSHGLRPCIDGWMSERRIEEEFERCLINKQEDFISEFGQEKVASMMDELKRRMSFIDARVKLSNMPCLLRIPVIFHHLSSGDYSYHNGWKSAVKDFLRKKGI